jgi:hypothetical protein
MVESTEPPNRWDGVYFKFCGVISVCAGLIIVGVGAWMAWNQWFMVSRWPRVTATVLSKEVGQNGARVDFTYKVNGASLSAAGFRWGPEPEVRDSLIAYEPGAVRTISYNPQNPGEIDMFLTYTWLAFRPAFIAGVFGGLILAGGVAVTRWARN